MSKDVLKHLAMRREVDGIERLTLEADRYENAHLKREGVVISKARDGSDSHYRHQFKAYYNNEKKSVKQQDQIIEYKNNKIFNSKQFHTVINSKVD